MQAGIGATPLRKTGEEGKRLKMWGWQGMKRKPVMAERYFCGPRPLPDHRHERPDDTPEPLLPRPPHPPADHPEYEPEPVQIELNGKPITLAETCDTTVISWKLTRPRRGAGGGNPTPAGAAGQ